MPWCLCWWWDRPAGTFALLRGDTVLGADLATCVSFLRGWLSVLLLLKLLEMKDFVGFYLEEALEHNV